MAKTFTRLYIQIIFAVRGRRSLKRDNWKDALYKYVTGIIHYNNHKLLAINGIENHIHMLIGYNPQQAVSKLVNDIKTSSNAFINREKLTSVKLDWPDGFGVFSYSKSSVYKVIQYILNQEQHHKKISLKEEYLKLLQDHEQVSDEAIFVRLG